MGNKLGTISIDLDAASANFVAGCDKATRAMESMASKAEANKGFADHLFGDLVGAELAAHAIEKVGEVAVEAARKFVEMMSELAQADQKAIRLASALGVSVTSLQSLQSAAKIGGGVDAETTAHAIEKMSGALAEAATKGGPVADALKQIGLDAKALNDESPDQAFLRIADGLSKVQNANQRIKLSEDIFGARQAKELLPVLSLGSDKLKEMMHHAEEVGAALSEADAGKVASMNRAVAGLGEDWEGIKQNLLVSIAPTVERIANTIRDSLPDMKKWSLFFGLTNVEDEYKAINEKKAPPPKPPSDPYAGLAEELRKIEAAAKAASAAAGLPEASRKIEELRDKYGQIPPAMQPIVDHIRELGQQEGIKKLTHDAEAALAMFGKSELEKHIHELSSEFGGLPESMEPAIAHLKEMAEQLDQLEKHKKVAEQLKTLANYVDAGGDEDRMKRLELTNNSSATFEDIAAYDKLDAAKKQIIADNKDLEAARKAAEESLTPAEKYNAEMEKLNRLLQSGKLHQDEFNAARKKAKADRDKADDSMEKKSAGAIERRFDFLMPGNTKRDTAEQQLEIQKETSKTITVMAGNLNQIYNQVVNGIGSSAAKPQIANFN